ncbi:MAG: T9SS C-terminal target domain-containing protein [Ignavibacteriae bacterium]|nr:MAG: T9SS C-terminal target domain-containing protein [Ignavibacteriota bacterium]
MHKSLLNSALIPAVILSLFCLTNLYAQPAVRITFRYFSDANYPRVNFPGTFNNWGSNTGGTIAAGDVSQADSLEAASGCWMKTISLPFGSYQYKIYRQRSVTPTDWSWIIDPLNRSVLTESNGIQNSVLEVNSLVLFQFCAYPYTVEAIASGSKFVCRTNAPSLSAGIFQPTGNPAATLTASVDGTVIANPSLYYNTASGIFTYKPAGLADGTHTFTVSVSDGSTARTDSVRFEVRARPVQIQTPAFTTWKPAYITAGIVLKPDGSGLDSLVSSVTLSVNGRGKTASVLNGSFIDTTAIQEGQNWIVVSTLLGRDSVLVTRLVNHTPWAAVTATSSGGSVLLDASASTDPDSQALSNFRWLDDPLQPLGLNGQTAVQVSIVKPPVPGEYYFGLIVTDPDGHGDTTRSSFVVHDGGSITNPTIASNPDWVKKGRIYFLFPKAVSSTGTLNAAALRLPYIKDLGFNIVWMMPVMKNASPINQQSGPGYNIVDFYNVAPEYGTNQDFKNFITQAHALGLKVILDVTPNHTSRFHPWSVDAHANKQKSPYWNWYQHTIIPHNDNGLGQSLDADGFNYYSGFSDQLLNYNWTDIDARQEMINVYKYWIKEFGLDGYRFDVYWGPHRRYGEQVMGKPVRDALKHIKPDILLLAEDDGTGSGTEVIYADNTSGGVNGGVDAAYDFKLYFNQVRGFEFNTSAVNSLDGDITNGGFYPGPNSEYMRFMESQDEDRIAYFYSSGGSLDAATTFMKTMPMASTIFTVPGLPMIWNGQEVGKGYGDNNFDSRRRGTIDWSFSGKSLLTPHYQKLAQIRGQYKAFSTHSMRRLRSTDGLVYAYTRPTAYEDGIVAVNFGSTPSTVSITISVADLGGWVNDGGNYIVSDLYNNTTTPIHFSNGAAILNLSLPSYGSAICILADSAKRLQIPSGMERGRSDIAPGKLQLYQNYPNPFNPQTVIQFDLPEQSRVKIFVYNVLGKEIAELTNTLYSAGVHQVMWNGKTDAGVQASSGVYFVRLETGSASEPMKIVLMK